MTAKSASRGPLRAAIGLLAAWATLNGTPASAQYAPEQDPAAGEIDWPFLFPLFGKKLANKGFELPYPAGVSLQYNYVSQDILIDDLQIAFNGGELVDASFVEFERVKSQVHMTSFRFDLWLFPFLNIYVLAGFPISITDTTVKTPPVDSSVQQLGGNVGLGGVVAYGIKNWFATMDLNYVWNFFPKTLSSATTSFVLGLRTGGNIDFRKGRQLAIWGGAMRVHVNPAGSGSLSLSEAVEGTPEDIRDGLEDLLESLPPPQQMAVEELLMQLGGNPQDATIQYKFDKQLERLWNMVIGLQYTVNKHWAFRAEGGLIKRWSLMLSGQYRFGIARRP